MKATQPLQDLGQSLGDGVTVVEWADKLLPLLPPSTITVTITGLGDEPRQIVIDGPPTTPRKQQEP